MIFKSEPLYCENKPKLKSECDCQECRPERLNKKRQSRQKKT